MLLVRLRFAGPLPPRGAGVALEAHGGESGLHAVRAEALRYQRGRSLVVVVVVVVIFVAGTAAVVGCYC